MHEVFDFPEHVVTVKDNGRVLESKDGKYLLTFSAVTGLSIRMDPLNIEHDPPYCPWGPEIADIEVTTRCEGIRGRDGIKHPCSFCYKSLTGNGLNMSFNTFKTIFDLLDAKKTLTQIAFGADAGCASNPDIWAMFDYCREHNVVPNITVADIEDDATALKLVSKCGAIAVSWYPLSNPNRCYDTVRKLLEAAGSIGKKGLQINIHALLADETIPFFDDLLDDYKNDKRLKGVNAIVLLSLKKKGRGVKFNPVRDSKSYYKLITRLFSEGIPFGMDSCGANKFLKYLDDHPQYKDCQTFVEPCESFGLFSSYINCEGKYFPCSFMEGVGEWKEGIDLLTVSDFEKEVWHSEKLEKDRKFSLNMIEECGCTRCPYFEI